MEKLASRSLWVNQQWGQSKEAAFLCPEASDMCHREIVSSLCGSNPIWRVLESAVLSRDREGLFLTVLHSSLPWAMGPLKLIHPSYIPLTDTHIPASPAVGLSLHWMRDHHLKAHPTGEVLSITSVLSRQEL